MEELTLRILRLEGIQYLLLAELEDDAEKAAGAIFLYQLEKPDIDAVEKAVRKFEQRIIGEATDKFDDALDMEFSRGKYSPDW